jgi:hypothetical protein
VFCLVEDTHASQVDKVGHKSPRKFPALHVINSQHPIHATHAQTSTEQEKNVDFEVQQLEHREIHDLSPISKPCMRRILSIYTWASNRDSQGWEAPNQHMLFFPDLGKFRPC